MIAANKLRLVLLFVSVALIFIVLAFGCMLNVASFKNNYVESLASGYKIAALQGKRNIEYAVRYGKPLDQFVGIEDILNDIKKDQTDIADIQLGLANGQVLYDLNGAVKGKHFAPQFSKKFQFGATEKLKDSAVVLFEGKYHLVIPVRDKKDVWIGTMDISFSESVVNAYVDSYLWQIVRMMLIIVACSAICLVLLFRLVVIITPSGQIMRKRLVVILLVVFGLAQMTYSMFNVTLFKQAYMDIAKENMQLVVKSVKEDIDFVVAKGVPYDRLVGLDEYLNKVVAMTPEIQVIALNNNQQQSNASYIIPLKTDKNGVTPNLELFIASDYIGEKIRSIWLEAATIAVLTFFLMFEIETFLLLILKRQADKNEDEPLDQTITIVKFVRPAAFVFFLGSDLCLSFIPMQMKNLYHFEWDLPLNVAMGIPISVEMFCAGVATLMSGYLVDKRGWRFPFFIGTAVICAGTLLSGLVESSLGFIGARGVVGTGYGLSWMALRGYIGLCPTAGGKATGFAQFSSGILAGSACGCALGAMLAERLGYGSVFFIGMVILMVATCFVGVFVKDFTVFVSDKKVQTIINAHHNGGSVSAFFHDSKVVAVLFLYVIPSTICTVGFLNYFFPVYSASLGILPADIGRSFMIYGICIIYLGAFVGQYIAKHRGEKKFVILAGFIAAAAMLKFSSSPGFVSALLVVFMLGVADSIGAIAQNTFYLNLESTQKLGAGKALAITGLVKKMGQMLGPITFSWIITGEGITGIGWIGASYVVILLFFAVLTRSRQSNQPVNSSS